MQCSIVAINIKAFAMLPFPRLDPSGIKVIVVGAGFAGISAAIECDRKGHSVTLLEKVDTIEEITRIGDIISFDSNGYVTEAVAGPDTSPSD